jgi:MFS family permease
MAVLLLVVFVDLLGFGLLIPLIPFYAERLGLSPGWITLVIALHSLMQFAAAPSMGRLSDRYGRRPVLMISMAGHALAYALLTVADSMPLLVASRLLSGVTSANLAAAYAYVSDITPPERRQEGFAHVSAAFALGFALGPALGGLLAGAGSPTTADLDPPAMIAAALSLLALAGIALLLPESHPVVSGGPAGRPTADARAHASGGTRAAQPAVLRDAALRLMLGLGVIVFACAAMRESLLSLWLHDRFAFDTHTIGMVFTINGLAIALVQSFATGPLGRRFGALATLRAGIACYAVSWLGLVLSPGLSTVALAMIAGAFGTALSGTSLQTLVSMRASPANRGAIMGAYQSGSGLARFFGAAISGSLFGLLGRDVPFALGAAAMIPALLMTLQIARRLANPANPPPA